VPRRLTCPGFPRASRYDGTRALARVEWSKGWGDTAESTWSDAEVLGSGVPATFDYSAGRDWARATAILGRLDPYGVYDNALLKRLFP